MTNLHVFILFPNEKVSPNFPLPSNFDSVVLGSKDSVPEFLSDFISALEWAFRAPNTIVFYDLDNLISFVSAVELFHSGSYQTNNFVERIRDALTGAKNWKENIKHDVQSKYFVWNISTHEVFQVFSESCSEAAECIISNDKVVLFTLLTEASIDRGKLTVFKDSIYDFSLPIFAHIPIVQNETELKSWIYSNQKQRIFRLNPKHGENGIGMIANRGELVSPLLCNRNEAQELLNKAVGDIRMSKELFAFDEVHKKFILFKDTNDGSYHGYHPDNQNEIPQFIMRLFS